MFVQAEGPTALRAELVLSLCVSQGSAPISLGGETRQACAALSAVWNGRKGHVVVLLRVLEPPLLQRFTYAEPLLALEQVKGAVEAGLAFAETLGLPLDAPEFTDLGAELQRERLAAWDSVRKLERTPLLPGETSKPEPQRSRQVLARIPVVTRALDPSGGAAALARLLAQL
jgi:hypothetical protein